MPPCTAAVVAAAKIIVACILVSLCCKDNIQRASATSRILTAPAPAPAPAPCPNAPWDLLLQGVQIPSDIAVPAGHELRVAYSAEGQQHYSFNGSAWVVVNATARLYADAARTVSVGQHLFLDVDGGQPTWRTDCADGHMISQVSATTLVAAQVDSDSITWNLLQAVSHGGNLEPLGNVTYVQRINTQNGLPPSASTTALMDPKTGDTHASEYSGIYAFYV